MRAPTRRFAEALFAFYRSRNRLSRCSYIFYQIAILQIPLSVVLTAPGNQQRFQTIGSSMLSKFGSVVRIERWQEKFPGKNPHHPNGRGSGTSRGQNGKIQLLQASHVKQ
jgi:hypothetical protein